MSMDPKRLDVVRALLWGVDGPSINRKTAAALLADRDSQEAEAERLRAELAGMEARAVTAEADRRGALAQRDQARGPAYAKAVIDAWQDGGMITDLDGRAQLDWLDLAAIIHALTEGGE